MIKHAKNELGFNVLKSIVLVLSLALSVGMIFDASALAGGKKNSKKSKKKEAPGKVIDRPEGDSIGKKISLELIWGEKVEGILNEFSEENIFIQVGKKPFYYPVEYFNPDDLYAQLSKLIPNTARHHLRLGKICKSFRLADKAKIEYNQAVKLKPELKEALKKEFDELKKLAKLPKRSKKSMPVTEKTLKEFREQAEEYGEGAKKIDPAIHLVETPHFLIYSAWAKNQDGALGKICEAMYSTLCRQFGISAREQFWAGKLPIYAFWEDGDLQKFGKIDGANVCDKTGGYNRSSSSGFTYVALGKVTYVRSGGQVDRERTQNWFLELLVHEATHAFLSRYLSNVHIKSWINEGLAETTAATLVKKAGAHKKMANAVKEYLSKKNSIGNIFTSEPIKLDYFDYGIAQSLVRYLIARDKKAFVKLIELMKQGKSDSEALKEAYKLTYETLEKHWRTVAPRLK